MEGLTCGVHREEVVFGQLLLLVEFGDLIADEISHGVHQTCEGYRPGADATNSRRQHLALPIPHRVKGKLERDLQIPGSNTQIVIIKQFRPQPTPRNIHPHTFKGSLDARICHLPRSVRSSVRMRDTPSNGPKPPAGGTTDRVRVARRRALLGGVTRRNLNRDRGPVISLGRRGGCNVRRGGWDTSRNRESVLDARGRVRGLEGLDLGLVIADLGVVRCNLLLEQIAIVGEKGGLSGDGGIVKFVDIVLVDIGEVGRQLITGVVICLECRLKIRP